MVQKVFKQLPIDAADAGGGSVAAACVRVCVCICIWIESQIYNCHLKWER